MQTGTSLGVMSIALGRPRTVGVRRQKSTWASLAGNLCDTGSEMPISPHVTAKLAWDHCSVVQRDPTIENAPRALHAAVEEVILHAHKKWLILHHADKWKRSSKELHVRLQVLQHRQEHLKSAILFLHTPSQKLSSFGW